MVRAIVGANWGDEGKGKITDMLAKESDIIIRFQGGSNAGHTIINEYGKFALHLLPSGVFYQHTTSIIGNGVALNIPYLIKEIQSLVDRGVPKPHILVSDRAQILMPYHVLFDTYEEARLAGKSFGSTKSGIAPFYSDKYAKIGFQVSELFDLLRLLCFETWHWRQLCHASSFERKPGESYAPIHQSQASDGSHQEFPVRPRVRMERRTGVPA